MKCQEELSNLNLTDEEQLTLNKEIEDGLEHNDKLKSLIEKKNKIQAQLKDLRLEKKEQALIDKNTIEDYQKVIDSKKDELEKLELMQLKEDNKQRKLDRSNKIQDYNKKIRLLMDAQKALISQKNALSDFIKETEKSLVSKYVKGNPNGARKEIFLRKLARGEISLRDIYSQIYITAKSLVVIKSVMKDRVFNGISKLAKSAQENPNNYNSKEMQAFIKHVYPKLNSIAKGLGILKDHGITDLERPLALSNDKIRNQLFHRSALNTAKEAIGFKPILNDEGLDEYMQDCINSFGEDEIKKRIDKVYELSDVKPTIRQAFLDIREALVTGRSPKLNFSNMEFLSDEAYVYMVKKYSDKTVFENIVTFLNRKINVLAISESTGGRLTDKQWDLDTSISDTERNHLKALADDDYGSQIGTTAGRYAREKILNGYGKLVLAIRPLVVYLAPLADRSSGVVLGDVERAKLTWGTYPKQIIGGFVDLYKGVIQAVGKGDADILLREFADWVKTDNEYKQQRFAIDSSPKSENNFYDKTIGFLFQKGIDNFHMQDNANQVNAVRCFSNDVRRFIDSSLDELPKIWREILKNRYNIDENDWQEIKKIAKNHELVTGDLFQGALAKKVTAIEITSVRRGMPLDFKISPALGAVIKNQKGLYLVNKMFTMFWRFIIQVSWHGLKDSYETNKAVGVIDYAARLMVRGFVPNMIIGGMFSYAHTHDINKTYNQMFSPSGIGDAFLGTIARPLTALAAWVGVTPSNDLGYQTSTPLIRDIRNTISALKHSAQYTYQGDYIEAYGGVINQILSMTAPGYAELGIKNKIKEYLKDR